MKCLRLPVALALAFLATLAAPASGLAIFTVGQSPPVGGTPVSCSANTGYVQGVVWKPQPIYRLGAAVITQWQFQAGTGGGTLALQTLSRAGFTNSFTPVAESAIETPTASTLNTFNTRIPVPAGETFLGLRVVTGNPECFYSSSGFSDSGGGLGDETLEAAPAPVVGSGSTNYGVLHEYSRLNLAVVIEADEDGDGFGDETEDFCPRKPERQDDCIKPTVTIKETPSDRTTKTTVTFKFSSDEPGGTFDCNIDQTKFKPCRSPLKLRKLKLGKHHFVVRAVDANGNKSEPYSYAYIVRKRR